MDHPFQRWVDLARPRSQIWRIVLSLVVIGACWVGWTLGLLYVAIATGITTQDAVEAVLLSGEAMVPYAGAVIALAISFGTFLGLWLGVWAALRFVHKRPFSSVLGHDRRIRSRELLIGALLAAGYLGLSFVTFSVSGVIAFRSSVPLDEWLIAMAPLVVLVFIQSAGEELVFRGYLAQALASRISRAFVWGFLPSFGFGLMHVGNGGDDMQFSLYYVAATTLMGLVMAATVWRTGGISTAMGFHTVNNVGALLVVGIGSSSPVSLYVVDVADLVASAPVDIFMLGLLLAFVLSPWAPLPKGQPLRRK